MILFVWFLNEITIILFVVLDNPVTRKLFDKDVIAVTISVLNLFTIYLQFIQFIYNLYNLFTI